MSYPPTAANDLASARPQSLPPTASLQVGDLIGLPGPKRSLTKASPPLWHVVLPKVPRARLNLSWRCALRLQLCFSSFDAARKPSVMLWTTSTQPLSARLPLLAARSVKWAAHSGRKVV